MPPKTLTIIQPERDRLSVPAPGESFIRWSPRVAEQREEIADLLGGRFLDMYNVSKETHERFDLIAKNQDFPSLAEAAGAFNPEDFDVASEYQEPGLILCPPNKNYEDLFDALAIHGEPVVRDGPRLQNSDHLDFDSGSHYRAFIAEAAARMLPIDDLPEKPLMERFEYKYDTRYPEEWGMSPDMYTLLMMESMVKGQMIDRQNFTLLDGEPIVADRFFPVGHCRKGRPTLEWFPPNISFPSRGRFRRVLGGRSIIGVE